MNTTDSLHGNIKLILCIFCFVYYVIITSLHARSHSFLVIYRIQIYTAGNVKWLSSEEICSFVINANKREKKDEAEKRYKVKILGKIYKMFIHNSTTHLTFQPEHSSTLTFIFYCVISSTTKQVFHIKHYK